MRGAQASREEPHSEVLGRAGSVPQGVWCRRAPLGVAVEQMPAALVPSRLPHGVCRRCHKHHRLDPRRTPGRATADEEGQRMVGIPSLQGFLDSLSGEAAVGSAQAEPEACR